MPHGRSKIQRLHGVEAALEPDAIESLPIAWRRAALLDIVKVLRVRHRPGRDRERRQLHVMRPFLVVENKALLIALRAETESATSNFKIGDGARTNSGSVPEFRLRVAKRLVGVVQRLGVHVLVQRHEAHEVAQALVLGLPG